MKKRKGWLVVLLLPLCLVAAAAALVVGAKTVPGIGRLFRGHDLGDTAPAVVGRVPISLLTATLTPPAPQASATASSTVAPPPSSTPSPTEPLPAAGQGEGTQAAPSNTPPPAPADTPAPAPTSSPTRPPPAATPRPHWIAFESHRGANGDYEIVAMAPDGSRQTNLTNSWADDVAPVWAPDGKAIAFLSFRDTLAGKWGLGKGSIYAMRFDPQSGTSSETWRVTDGAGADDWPSWSPDGSRIAFQSDRGGNSDIWIVNVDGTGLVQLTHDASDDLHPDWSSDGTKIAFTSKRSGDADVWVLDVGTALASGDDSSAVNLTHSPGVDRYPIWSPDDRQLTFHTDRDGNGEIYLMNADGSEPRNVSRSESKEGLADWSPDGKWLVFYSDRSGDKEVYLLELATLAWTNISNHPADDEFCTWSP